jgi:putative tryptophan/tyrosine transport system substrate-binding protein
LQLLHEVIPDASVFGTLASASQTVVTQSTMTDLQAAARALGLQLIVANVGNDTELDAAFATFSQQRVRGVMVSNGPFQNRRIDRIAALSVRHALPAIFPYREFTLAGGLMSYGSSFTYTARQLGIYTGRILKGEKPADLPVQQNTKIEFVINLKTAKALGLTIPETLLATADEVIQ